MAWVYELASTSTKICSPHYVAGGIKFFLYREKKMVYNFYLSFNARITFHRTLLCIGTDLDVCVCVCV